jgi:hypothetical protein
MSDTVSMEGVLYLHDGDPSAEKRRKGGYSYDVAKYGKGESR